MDETLRLRARKNFRDTTFMKVLQFAIYEVILESYDAPDNSLTSPNTYCMSIPFEEIFEREITLAHKYQTRTPEVLIQQVQCPRCDQSDWIRHRFTEQAFQSIDEIEELMLQFSTSLTADPCSHCNHSEVHEDGDYQYLLVYSEQLQAYLVVRLSTNQASSEGSPVHRQQTIVFIDGNSRTITAEDPRLTKFWTESSFRSVLAHGSLQRMEALVVPFIELDAFRSIALREYSSFLLEQGKSSDALTLITQSLTENPEQPELMQTAGQLHATYGYPRRASELFFEAWEQTEQLKTLASATITSLRGRDYGRAEVGGHKLLAFNDWELIGAKALASTGTVGNCEEMLNRWERLQYLAEEHGDRVGAYVAKYWVNTLQLPIPDWQPEASSESYREQLRESLEDHDHQIIEGSPPMTWGEARFHPDLVVEDPFGARYVFFLSDCRSTAWATRNLIARARALRLDPAYAGSSGIILSQQIVPYAIYRYFSHLPDAQLDLEVDADTTLDVHEENLATWLWAAEKYFGCLCDYTLESLHEIDRILLRYHDDGFGAIEHPLICLISSYIAEVLQRTVGSCTWVDGQTTKAPRVLQLPTGDTIDVIRHLYHMVQHGDETTEGLYDFVLSQRAFVEQSKPRGLLH